jgi:SWIM zinc finger
MGRACHGQGRPRTAPTADQARALAPDASAARAGEGLASVRHWPKLGRTERLVWGLCQGSGADPYQVAVDLAGPTFKCSCPSRKFPCKHGLGILLLHATQASAFSSTDVPTWVSDWLAARDVRAAAAVERATKTVDVDPAAQARRAEARERKIAAPNAWPRWCRAA